MIFAFLQENWIEVGSAVAGLITILLGILTYQSGKEKAKQERAKFNFSVDKSYDRIWSKYEENPKLSRITADSVDLKKQPVTLSEERFVLAMLTHITSTMKAIELGTYAEPEGMELDIVDFFTKPVPRAIAKKTLKFQSKEVQRLLNKAILGKR